MIEADSLSEEITSDVKLSVILSHVVFPAS